MCARSRAGTRTLTAQMWSSHFLFAQARSCSTQISRQWTFPSSLAYFDSKQARAKGCWKVAVSSRALEQIQAINTSCGLLLTTACRLANCCPFRFPFEASQMGGGLEQWQSGSCATWAFWMFQNVCLEKKRISQRKMKLNGSLIIWCDQSIVKNVKWTKSHFTSFKKRQWKWHFILIQHSSFTTCCCKCRN